LYVCKDLKAGDVLSKENVRAIRPGYGLAPKFFDLVMGKRVNRDMKRGEALRWEFIG
jgi:N-acetylneuraminate synthase